MIFDVWKKNMRIKGKFTLGAAATGLIGVGSVLASILSVQNDEVLLDSHESIKINEETEATIVTASSKRPGRVGVKGLRNSGEIGDNIMKSFRKILASEECENRGGEWNSEKCIIPEELYKDIKLDERFDDDISFSSLSREECYGRGGYHMVTSDRHGTENCMWPGILVKKDFEREITEWDTVAAKAPNSSMKSMSHFFNEGFMEIKRDNKQYAVLIPENKLTGGLSEWKFPRHLKQDTYAVAIKDICEWAKGSMENGWTTSFLYNGKSGRGWDCIGNKEIIFYTEEETAE